MIFDRDFIVLGAGGHAKVVLDALLRLGARVRGLADTNSALCGQSILGHLVLGCDDIAKAAGPDAILLANGIGVARDTRARRAVYEEFRGLGFRFPAVVDPSAVVGGEVAMADGAQVLAGAVVQPGASLGENCIVNTLAGVDHDCSVGPHSHIAPGVTLCGAVRVGAGCLIGAGATILPGVAIGDGAIVGAGCTVRRTITPGVVFLGCSTHDS